MPFHQSSSLRYYQFDSLNHTTHAIFTRRGGVSPAPWASLNLGSTVGDNPECVWKNRELAFGAVNRPIASLYDVWQVHSAEIVIADAPRQLNQPHIKADAILTNCPEVTLFMRFADCVPILLFDPHHKVIGMVHAGWLGTVLKTVSATVRMMHSHYDSVPQDLIACIGPSIAAHHYEVGQDVAAQVKEVFGSEAARLLPSTDGAVQFDLWSANRLLLEQEGLTQIEVAGICTACHLDDWYSHRGEHGKTGRFGAIISL